MPPRSPSCLAHRLLLPLASLIMTFAGRAAQKSSPILWIMSDDTAGSTAGIKVGESVSVRDCLRGLMLPSGNDAGNALAEHFNSRYAPPDDAMLACGLANPALATRVNFIAEMNRTAGRLGRTSTK